MKNPIHPCKIECERLLALAAGIADSLPEKASLPIKDWQTKVRAFLNDPIVESLDGEKKLEIMAMDLRHRWLRIVHSRSDQYLMSPPHSQPKLLPDGNRFRYPYDRWLKPAFLEKRLSARQPPQKGWTDDHIVFSSGMSAITTFLQCCSQIIAPFQSKGQRRNILHWFGGYFEIDRALRQICNDNFRGRRCASQQTFLSDVEKGVADIIFIEPVAANWGLEVFDMDGFIAAWKKRKSARPCIIIIDTSLLGDCFSVDKFCQALAPNKHTLVVQITSGLKLDQEGLEFSNVGLMSLYAPQENCDAKRMAKIGNKLRLARTSFGAALSQNELASLDLPFFLKGESRSRHSKDVFKSNEMLAKALKPGKGLFTDISHPGFSPLKNKPWAQSPFVNFRYAAEGDDSQEFLRAVFRHEAKVRNLCFISGSSFGFRGHRFEMGFVRGASMDTFRIAMGARVGPSQEGVIQLFKDLAKFPDFQAVRAAYPMLKKISTSEIKILPGNPSSKA